jgi:hypothetical protein
MNISVSRSALFTSVACVLATLLLFAAPSFRQGIRVSFAAWRTALAVTAPDRQGELRALAKRAEARHDPEGLVFVAARLWDRSESARLAEEAVHLDPNLVWSYAIVAVRHPDLPQITQWVSRLQCWDPQNALLHLIRAESTDIALLGKTSKLSPQEARNVRAADPARQSALAAAFASPKFDDYLDRLKELDRKVVLRYRFDDPYELLSGEEDALPTYAFQDSVWFADPLVRSGQELEARGDRKGAAEKYWTVARFGQVIDSQGRTASEHVVGAFLQASAYKQLQALSEKERNPEQAALFGYLAARFTPSKSACPGGT